MFKFFVVFSLLCTLPAFSQELMLREGEAAKLVFNFNGNLKEVNVKPLAAPKAVNEKKYGGFYTEFDVYNISSEESFSFGVYREKLTDLGGIGLWHVKNNEISKVYSAYAGRFYEIENRVFFYLNRKISQHEKNGIVFEIVSGDNKQPLFQEVYFVMGWILELFPISGNTLQVVSFSDSVEDFRMAKVSVVENGSSIEYGDFVDQKTMEK